jgi:phosphoribosyl-ATP pyrophosphohydrolase/phosphoribosyl-AMP cyclohydrolase
VSLHFDERGLIPAVVQDRLTGQLRMVAWMNQEALRRTLESGRATFYSRSRESLWEKGETSGNGLKVVSVTADCDADTLLVLADPEGPSCHTGRPSCFFQRVLPDGSLEELPVEAGPFLAELEDVIRQRQSSPADRSYTRSLLDGGAERIGSKIREEAAELAQAIAEESDERVAAEAGDLIYHLLVGLRLRGVDLASVLSVLAARSGTSGHTEKASRRRR